MSAFEFEGGLAPIAGAIRFAGKDGAARFVIEVEGGPAALIALAEMGARIGKHLRFRVEEFTPQTYGGHSGDE